MRNPKQPRIEGEMGRNRPVSHQKRMARVSLRKGGGPAGGSSFFTKRTWVRRATAGSWDRRGWPGRGRARAGGSGQGEAGRARLGPGTRPDEAPLQEETNRERVRLARRDKRQEAAMGSAGRSGSAATTRATSAQTDGAILADAEHAPDTAREKRSRVTEKARLLGDGAVPCQEATRTSGRVQGTNAATSGP